MLSTLLRTAVAVAALALPAIATAGTNIIPTRTLFTSWPGGDGVLRPGSPWGPGSTPSNVLSITDGVFEPTNQQWNNGSFWWDQTQTGSPFQITLQLTGVYTIDRLVLQADDNDGYLVEYWDGAAWQDAFNAAPVFTFGLETRDSGVFPAFATDRFRLSAISGDDYYAISEFQAFAVPEPATWAMMIAGFGFVGGAMRRRVRMALHTA